MKTCVYCGQPIDPADEDVDETAHVWCAGGEEPPEEPPPLDEIFKLDSKGKV